MAEEVVTVHKIILFFSLSHRRASSSSFLVCGWDLWWDLIENLGLCATPSFLGHKTFLVRSSVCSFPVSVWLEVKDSKTVEPQVRDSLSPELPLRGEPSGRAASLHWSMRNNGLGAAGWLSRLSFPLVILAQVVSPALGFCVDSTAAQQHGTCLGFSPSLSAPPPLTLFLSLSQNK